MKSIVVILFSLFLMQPVLAQMPDAPDRNEGEGPFNRLIIRGVTMIDGTGSPAVGPVDIVIENNRIARIVTVGYPGVPVDERRRPEAGENDYVLDLEGSFVLPGFIDMHAKIGRAHV